MASHDISNALRYVNSDHVVFQSSILIIRVNPGFGGPRHEPGLAFSMTHADSRQYLLRLLCLPAALHLAQAGFLWPI